MSTIKTTTLSNVAGTSSVPVDTVINGSAKAWVNFNGTGTVAIRASFNVSSITDNGTGDYTVNFTTAMPDANYCVNGISSDNPTINTVMAVDNRGISSSSIRVATFIPSSSNALTDRSYNFVSIIR